MASTSVLSAAGPPFSRYPNRNQTVVGDDDDDGDVSEGFPARHAAHTLPEISGLSEVMEQYDQIHDELVENAQTLTVPPSSMSSNTEDTATGAAAAAAAAHKSIPTPAGGGPAGSSVAGGPSTAVPSRFQATNAATHNYRATANSVAPSNGGVAYEMEQPEPVPLLPQRPRTSVLRTHEPHPVPVTTVQRPRQVRWGADQVQEISASSYSGSGTTNNAPPPAGVGVAGRLAADVEDYTENEPSDDGNGITENDLRTSALRQPASAASTNAAASSSFARPSRRAVADDSRAKSVPVRSTTTRAANDLRGNSSGRDMRPDEPRSFASSLSRSLWDNRFVILSIVVFIIVTGIVGLYLMRLASEQRAHDEKTREMAELHAEQLLQRRNEEKLQRALAEKQTMAQKMQDQENQLCKIAEAARVQEEMYQAQLMRMKELQESNEEYVQHMESVLRQSRMPAAPSSQQQSARRAESTRAAPLQSDAAVYTTTARARPAPLASFHATVAAVAAGRPTTTSTVVVEEEEEKPAAVVQAEPPPSLLQATTATTVAEQDGAEEEATPVLVAANVAASSSSSNNPESGHLSAVVTQQPQEAVAVKNDGVPHLEHENDHLPTPVLPWSSSSSSSSSSTVVQPTAAASDAASEPAIPGQSSAPLSQPSQFLQQPIPLRNVMPLMMRDSTVAHATAEAKETTFVDPHPETTQSPVIANLEMAAAAFRATNATAPSFFPEPTST